MLAVADQLLVLVTRPQGSALQCPALQLIGATDTEPSWAIWLDKAQLPHKMLKSFFLLLLKGTLGQEHERLLLNVLTTTYPWLSIRETSLSLSRMMKLIGDEPLPASQWKQKTRDETAHFHQEHSLSDRKISGAKLQCLRNYAFGAMCRGIYGKVPDSSRGSGGRT